MKVAIMGAGISGLCCGIMLEKCGIKPTIFESRSQVGDRFINGEAMFNIFNKPINNCLTYIADKYDIHLEPLHEIKKMIFHSKNEAATIEGNLGLSNIRGRHDASFERQLARQFKSEIIFNSKYTLEDLKKEFTHVVLATGDGAYATQLGNYRLDLTYSLKGVTIEGNFEPSAAQAWFNYAFVPKGYAYHIPFSEKEAHIVMAYPDYEENKRRDSESMWQQFYDQMRKDMGQDFKITDGFEITRFIVGICQKPKLDNVYFTGNCFGAISPALGFGQFIAILTGIYAALDICGVGDYEKLTEPLFENYENSLVLRRGLERLTDAQFDLIIKNLDNKIFDKWLNKIHSDESTFDFLKWVSRGIKPWVYKSQ